MHLPDTKSEGNSADNCKLSSGFQTIYLANQILNMFSIYPNVPELTKLTFSELYFFLIKQHKQWLINLNYEVNILIANVLGRS